MSHDAFSVGELTAVIGDNEGHDGHRPGYSGLHSLTSVRSQNSLFVPAYAGLNLEHIFDGHNDSREAFYEPRQAAMTFERLGDDSAELHQPPTPIWGVESWTRFALRAPYYIDFEFRCVPHREAFASSYIGLFWASYINAARAKAIRFLGRPEYDRGERWVEYCTLVHGRDSTVCYADDATRLTFAPNYRERHALFANVSPLVFTRPFYYGIYESMAYLIMFDRGHGIRFSHSPSGGGGTASGDDTNPAWDFQFIIPDYRVGQEYGFRACVAYKAFQGREDVLDEYEKWRQSV